MSKHYLSLTGVSIFIYALVQAYHMQDPDYGWHIQTGKLLLEKGLHQLEHFSYTMPSYPFADFEWATNIYMYKLHEFNESRFLTSVLYSLMLCLTLVFSLSNSMGKVVDKKTKKYSSILLLLLTIQIFDNYYGIRPQVSGWFFLSIFLYVLLNDRIWSKCKVFVIPLFLIWANLHPSFVGGLVTMFCFLLIKSFRTKKIFVGDVFVLIVSVLSTLINPFGYHLWREIWLPLTDTSLRWTILEWNPVFFRFDPALILFFSISVVMTWKYKSKYKLEELCVYLLYLVQAILTTRYVPLWLLVSVPMLILGFGYLYKEVELVEKGITRLVVLYKVTLIIILAMFFIYITAIRFGAQSDITYPSKAIEHLKQIQSTGQTFAPYNWGGYLIWKYPENKVYIDGRMSCWRWNDAPENESNNAMRDYKDLLSGEIDYKLEFEKYGIDTVLWFAPKEENFYERIDNIIYKYLKRFSQGDEDKKGLLESLKDDGWVVVYEDDTALIYQKRQ